MNFCVFFLSLFLFIRTGFPAHRKPDDVGVSVTLSPFAPFVAGGLQLSSDENLSGSELTGGGAKDWSVFFLPRLVALLLVCSYDFLSIFISYPFDVLFS